MNKLVIALVTCADDAPLSERLLEWIYHLNGKQAKGHLLLAWAADVHAEMRTKIRICADLAFESVAELAMTQSGNPQNKIEQINLTFRQVSKYVQANYRWPWLWLDPDAVPLKPEWIDYLATVYDTQAFRYCGSIMGTTDGSKLLGMARVGMYHPAAFSDLDQFCSNPETGFEYAGGERVMLSATKTRLIQQFSITDDASMAKIRSDAVLLHGDKWGKVIRKLKADKAVANGVPHVKITPELMGDYRRDIELIPTAPKLDKRTKAYRALKARQKAQSIQ